MSSDAAHHHHHHNQQLIHNHYEYEFHNHNGFVQSRDHFQHLNECRHEEEMETEMAVLPEAIIRGNSMFHSHCLLQFPCMCCVHNNKPTYKHLLQH